MGIFDILQGRKKSAGKVGKPIVKSRKGRTGEIRLAGKTALEEILNLGGFAEELCDLADGLPVITESIAKDLFRKVGPEKPNEYRSGIEVFSKFRAYSLSAKGSSLRTYYLTIDPSSDRTDALYVYLDDRVMPIGVVVCKVEKKAFWGRYTVGPSFKERLGL